MMNHVVRNALLVTSVVGCLGCGGSGPQLPVVGEGELCISIAGPVATCAEGLACVVQGPDLGVCMNAQVGASCEGCALPSFKPMQCPDGSWVAPTAECVYQEDLTCGAKITPAPPCPTEWPVVGEGELCASIMGQVAMCADGLECVYVYPDNGVCQKVIVVGGACEGCSLPSFQPRLCPDGSLVAPSAECVYQEDLTCGTKITPAPECPPERPVVGEGELCASIAGSIATCEPGFECTYLYPDYGVCQKAAGGLSVK